MVQKQQIILDYFKKGMSIRQISRETGLHRKTVSSHIEKFKQETGSNLVSSKGVVGSPEYDSSNRKPRKLTEQIQAILRGYIQDNEHKISNRMRKQCMCATDMHEALTKRGFDIGYTTVSQFVKKKTRRRKEKYIKQHHPPGRIVEFDWGHVKVYIDGELTKLNLAVFSMPYSNRRWAYLFERQDMVSFLLAHVLFFHEIGGVPEEIVYDNMRTAVAEFSSVNKSKVPTEDLLKLSSYYLFNIRFCNARKGNEKGHVERSVEYVRRKAFSEIFHFGSLEQATKQLTDTVIELNGRISSGHELTNMQRFEEERNYLSALPASAYEVALIDYYKVSKYSAIQVENNHYSVPDYWAEDTVKVKIYPNQIFIYDLKDQLLAKHHRLIGNNKWSLTLEHYRLTLLTKPGAVANSVALHQASPIARDLFNNHFRNKPAEFVKILNYLADSAMSLDTVGPAIKEILDKAPHINLSFDYIKCQLQANHTCHNPVPVNDHKCELSSIILQSCNQQLNDYQNLF